MFILCDRLMLLMYYFADDDVEQPSSPSVKKSEEKGVTVVHEMKCKLYVKVASRFVL